jgi:hypothetical protein
MASHGQSLAAASELASNESASVPRSSGGLGLSAADMMSSSPEMARLGPPATQGTQQRAVLLLQLRDDQGPGSRIHIRQNQAIKTEQPTSGHDASNNCNGGRHITLHGPMPHSQLKVVQPLDLQAAELSDGLSRLGLQGLRDNVIDGAPIGIAQL